MNTYQTFAEAIEAARRGFEDAPLVRTEKWQALDATHRPELATYEQLFFSFKTPMRHTNLKAYQIDIKPDLPWADDHFAERISGQPLNPPPSEAWWPHAPTNATFKVDGEKFSHTYPERYWPRFDDNGQLRQGIRYRYGDLDDLVALLVAQPFTRQAYMPVFFPEDTGAAHGERIPCSLGYHFIRRGSYLHIVYYLRSCDFLRHFRNDIYFTVRLLLWVLDRTQWTDVRPGTFVMHITSLHLFVNDREKIGL